MNSNVSPLSDQREAAHFGRFGAAIDITVARDSHSPLEGVYHDIQAPKHDLQKENIVLREEIDRTSMFEEIVGVWSCPSSLRLILTV